MVRPAKIRTMGIADRRGIQSYESSVQRIDSNCGFVAKCVRNDALPGNSVVRSMRWLSIRATGWRLNRQRVLTAGRHIMEAYQVDLVAATVLRDAQQIGDARESGFARKVVGDVFLTDRLDRIDDHAPVGHGIAATDLHVRADPNPHRAPDSAAADSIPQPLLEQHQGHRARDLRRSDRGATAGAGTGRRRPLWRARVPGSLSTRSCAFQTRP